MRLSSDVSSSDENGEDVKNVSLKDVSPISQSEKRDEFKLNLTQAEFYTYLNHAWNDVYWLANLVIWMGFFGLLMSHHADLRLQMIGARMRIACCSLIYRKVNIGFFEFLMNDFIDC